LFSLLTRCTHRLNALTRFTSRIGAAAMRASLMGCAVILATAAQAQQQPGSGTTVEPLRREILALYDGRDEARPDQTRIHRFAEMPLNHLGYVVSYWDINAGLPPPERTARLHGLVSWLSRAQPARYYLWARALVLRGARMVVLGNGGVPFGGASPDEANRLFEAIGFRMSGTFIDLTYNARVLYRDRLIGFEQPLDPVLPAFPVVGTWGADVATHLTLENHDAARSLVTSLVITGKHGGYAAGGYLVYEEPITGRTKWIVDPFAFFKLSFGAGAAPIPDVTTLSGRRIYFSHIDGDGWNNVSRIEVYHDKDKISAEVVLRELIAPYPDLPVTVGVIGADVDDRYGRVDAARRVARALYALPQVEVATHTYTHPYEWPFFENYDRDLEEKLTGAGDTDWSALVGDRVARLAKRLVPGRSRKARADAKADDNTRLVDDDPPRAFNEYPFDLDQETRGAVRAAEELAPPGKRAALYLWSGGAEPFEAAIAATRALGVRNMNGGDSRTDADYPSISYLSPIARPVGAERQIYAGAANDYLFVTDGSGRDAGYLNLDATLAATETPRRLKPVNIYYHMFAGERAAQLAAVRHHLDAARAAPVTPIVASHYAAIADGFFATEITALDDSTWLVRHRGALETLRLDDAADLAVDFDRSVGVLGQRRKGSTLYVALDEAQPDVLLAVAPRASLQANAAVAHLIEGRWVFRDLRRADCGFGVMAKGFGTGAMRWGGLTPGAYSVTVHDGDMPVWEGAAEVGEDGVLAITAEANATHPLAIDVACVPPREGG
jgi:hypothetical protein